MGAEQFTANATGATPEAAFEAARQQAFYDYGHAGYTGTIAEKTEFTLIKDTLDDIKKAAVERGEDLGGWVHKAIATANTPDQKAEAIAEVLMGLDDRRVTDKWGPAGCIEVEPGSYLFFGVASS